MIGGDANHGKDRRILVHCSLFIVHCSLLIPQRLLVLQHVLDPLQRF